MRIESGNGLAYEAEVDKYFRLLTKATTLTEDKFKNLQEGKVWSLYSSSTAAGAGDYVFYLKNTGTEVLSVSDIQVIAGAATIIYLDRVTGVPSFTSGADIVPLSRNGALSASVSATIKQDTDTTGLSSVGVLCVQACPAAATSYKTQIDGDILIPQNGSVAIRTSAATSIELLITLTAAL